MSVENLSEEFIFPQKLISQEGIICSLNFIHLIRINARLGEVEVHYTMDAH